MKKTRIAALASLCIIAGLAQAKITIFYVRHGETPSNEKPKWEKVPKEQWPEYMTARGHHMTPKGFEQADKLVETLKPYKFDFIAVSSLDRAQLTILPYLKANNRRAEVWPELRECGGAMDRKRFLAEDLPPAPADLYEGPRTRFNKDAAPYLDLRESSPNEVKRYPEDREVEAAGVSAMITRVVDRIKRDFSDGDKTILLVGHGRNSYFMRTALGLGPLPGDGGHGNTMFWTAEEQEDGSFKMVSFNGVPVEDYDK